MTRDDIKKSTIGHLEDVREDCATVIEQVAKVISILEKGGKLEMRDYDKLMDSISDVKSDGEFMLDRLGMSGYVNEEV